MGVLKDLVDLVADLNSRVENRQFAADLREIQTMIAGLQSEHAELHEKRIDLLQENADLKQKLLDLEQQIAELKSESSDESSVPVQLEEAEEKILLFIAKMDRVTTDEVAHHLSESVPKTEYWLDRLCDMNLISFSLIIGGPTPYYIRQGGREYLVKRGLL